MQIASRLVVFALGSVLATALVAASVGESAAPTRSAKLERTLKTLVARADSPGGVLLVQTPDGTWRGATGLARIKPRTKMTVSARFRVASVTKTFTAALVLRLVVDGTLSLSDTVERWLPGRVPGGAGAAITLRHLLDHTSGIAEDPSLAAGPPGTYLYTDANYILLGEIVQAATGSPFDAQLRERVLAPLRLTRSEPATASPVPAQLVHGYSPTRPRVDLTLLPAVGPAAGLVSTAADLVKFERALFNGQVIPAELVAAMRTPGPVGAMDTAGYDAYGLGLMRFSSTCGHAWGHRGRIPGYTAWMLSTADGKRSVAALLNVGRVGTGNSALVRTLSRLVTAALCT